jgi:predicted RND superfamily exporter protein
VQLEHPREGMTADAPRGFPLALGTERFGLLTLRHPLIGAAVFVVLAIAAAFGVLRIKADDSLSQLFRSNTPEFQQYEEVTRRFPSSEYDVLVVVEGATLLERDHLAKLRDVVTDLQLVDGTRGIISLFSAREPPERGGSIPEPLFPEELPQGATYDALINKVMNNEIIRGKLLSLDGQLALIVLALDPEAVSTDLAKVVGEVRKTVRDDLAGTGLKGELSGVPVMQLDIRNAMERDRVVYNALGFVAGCLIAIVFYRRVSFMLIAAAPPLTAILLSLGALGWLDFRLNIFLNVMTPLIMVISFSDSMQLTFLARDRLIAGYSKAEAFRAAILIAGPACVLTHATAGLSFFSLLFANSDLIRTFGEAGIIATVVALITVLTLVPLLGMLLVRGEPNYLPFATIGTLVLALVVILARAHAILEDHDGSLLGILQMSSEALQESLSDLVKDFTSIAAVVVALAVLLVHGETDYGARTKGADSAVDLLRRFCGYIAHRMVSRPGLYTLIATLAIMGLGIVYLNLQPRYRLADLVPDKEQAVQASGQLDLKLTGANPLDILIEFPNGKSLYDPQTLVIIAQVHAIMETQAGIGNVWSLETLRRWLAEKLGKNDAATLKQYVDALPPYLVRRFISGSEDAVVISGRVPDADASKLLPIIQSLDARLAQLREANPGYRISVTGLSAIAARNSAEMIKKLNLGLTIEIVFVAAFIGLAFRSFVVMLAVILPGIFPVLMSGDILYVLGDGLQFASIVALTVSFGLALSATIHFLNRLRLEERPGEDPGGAVERATVLVGPALILTSVVLACGLAATVFSNLPSLRLFGWLSAFAMIAALIADLLILRPTIMFLRRAFGHR